MNWGGTTVVDQRRSLVAVAVLGVLVVSCAQTRKSLVTPEFSSAVMSIRSVGVLVVESEVLDLGAFRKSTPNAEKTGKARTCLGAAAVSSLQARGFEAVLLPDEEPSRELAREYRTLRGDIMMERKFAGSAGKIEGMAPLSAAPAVLRGRNLDGVLLVSGIDHHASVASRLAGLSPILGGGGAGIAYADIALLDATGRILFYDEWEGSDVALTEEKGAARVCRELSAGLVAGTRP